MSYQSPLLITINPDEYHAEHVGRTADGRQFFLTAPFVAGTREQVGREFAALYIFDAAGTFLESYIEELGLCCQIEVGKELNYPAKFLILLGKIFIQPVQIKPFNVEKFGITFGLLLRPGETEEDPCCAEVEPGNYMAFIEPFDSGHYVT